MESKPAIEGGGSVREEYLTFFKIVLEEDAIREVVETLRSGWLTTGPRVKKFETEFKNYLGVPHAIGLNSCTAGLFLGLKLLDLPPGSEIITTPLTFAATANVIIHAGHVPVFADIDPATFNIDPRKIEEKITDKTGAILVVHLFGRPCDMDGLSAISEKYELPIMADAAHAIESEWKGRRVGSLSDTAAYSFYATKNVITGEGGMLTFADSQWSDRAAHLRLHGMSRDAWKRYGKEGIPLYDVVEAGYKMNMTDMQAALGLQQIAKIEERWKLRESLWNLYQRELTGLPMDLPPQPDKLMRHAYHLFNILIRPEELRKTRNEIIAALHAEKIGTGLHFPALHLTTYYAKNYGYRAGDFPNTERISEQTISLPFSPYMSKQDALDVVEACRKVLRYYRK